MGVPFNDAVKRRFQIPVQILVNNADRLLPVAPPPVMVMPVMVMPAPVAPTPAPVTMVPAPMAVVPTPVPVMAPMHLFGLELVDLFGRRHGGVRIIVHRGQLTVSAEWLRQQWRRLGAGGKRCTGHESEGKSEKMSAFHVPLLAFPTIDREESLAGVG
jgi:hypothetical protein